MPIAQNCLARYCTRILGSRPEAEDAVQETLLRAWRAQGQLEGRSALRPWMYRIASNVCMTYGGGQQRASACADDARDRRTRRRRVTFGASEDSRLLASYLAGFSAYGS